MIVVKFSFVIFLFMFAILLKYVCFMGFIIAIEDKNILYFLLSLTFASFIIFMDCFICKVIL